MRYFFTGLLCLLFLFTSKADDGFKIEFEVKNYQFDTLVIGVFYGDRQLVKDSLVREKKNRFVYEGKETLDPGVYMMLVQPENKYIQFLVPEDDQNFRVNVDANDLNSVNFEKSKDNQLFMSYQKFVKSQNVKLASLNERIDTLRAQGLDFAKQQDSIYMLDDEVLGYLHNLVKDNPGTLTSLIVKSSFNVDIPIFEGTEEEVNLKRYVFFKKNFFNDIELDNPASLRTPFLHNKIEYYVNKLTPQAPDSVIQSVEYILDKVKPAKDTYKFYISYFLNTYAKSKIIGFDKVYVHMVDAYYKSGIADWVDDETLVKIVDRAEKIKPVLIGKTAPDLTLYKEDGSTVNIHDVDAEYTVLMFWAPDCGHCKKSMPAVVEFYDKFKDRGVELIAICTKHQSKYKSCWEFLEEKDMTRFLNLGDQYHRSRFKLKYNVTSTPKIFVLDRNKEILIKNIGGDQLETIMDEIIQLKKSEE